MRVSWIATAALASCVSATFGEHDVLAAQGLANLGLYVAVKGYSNSKACTLKNVRVRREWSLLTKPEKLNYINAVQCLAKKPARTPAAVAAGARSRYDDFVVTHILQTMSIHGTANFLAWHRYYLLAYEDTLRNECGYNGYQPYYNWAWWADNPKVSPLFDGSDTSLSGDGAYVPGWNARCFATEQRCSGTISPANGGGCVTSGPLKDWITNLGPVQSLSKEVVPNPQSDGLSYNPRCIRRDTNPYAAAQTTDDKIVDLLTNYKNISAFQDRMQSAGPFLGVHLGGHYTIGGDAGSDFFNSPSDPTFFFHHGMIDRMWWIWQNLNLETRQRAIAGTSTFLNLPPSRNGTFEDVLSMGYVGVKNITIGDTMSTLGGPFCYVYA
ncbi:Di-copper centre-containing protein [Setomelanomma holmii]|uniref:Di-copper centre-containing protein n=1 Tax=Setomelanomma holmii TaxID=210430 RepID=A0A9P4HN24_9PLEO|nr:Di-copper centre-containing protein [Setomelanomma holmii]